jgi:hypothetical protein
MRGVFDRMITGKENPSQSEIQEAKNTITGGKAKTNRTLPKISLRDKNSPLAIILDSLERLKDEYSGNNPYATNAVYDVFRAAKEGMVLDKKELGQYLNVDNRDPAEIALTSLWNVSRDTVASGGVHFYRGTLSDRGKGYLYVYNKTVDILLERGFIDDAEAESNRHSIRQDIKNAG